MGVLKDKGLVTSDNTASGVFEGLFGTTEFSSVTYTDCADYVKKYWDAYLNSAWFASANDQAKRSVNGKVFEHIIETLFINEGIVPFYIQTEIQYVPNVDFDLVLIREEGKMVAISLKTSLRERYKQADLEASALKNVHRKALCYLFTLPSSTDPNGITNANKKIKAGDVLGLTEVVDCTSTRFNDVIDEIKQFTHRRSIDLPEIKTGKVIL